MTSLAASPTRTCGITTRGTAMKLGAYTACLHDRSLPETLKILRELGLTSAEINAGGFIPAPQLPAGHLLYSASLPADPPGPLGQARVTPTGLQHHRHPQKPHPRAG